jgi:membrane protein DedA with SNARE-associated domain
MLEFVGASAPARGSEQRMDFISTAPYLPLADNAISDLAHWLIGLPALVFHSYTWLLAWVADSIRTLFDRYGYLVIFLGTLFENTLLLGLIVPGLIVVLLAGLNAHDGGMNIFYAALLGMLGTVLGDTISYFMGRFGWARLSQGESMRAFSERVRQPLLERGAFFVFAYHFAGYTRLFGPTAAGLFRIPYRKWAPLDHAGAVVWVGTFIGIGYGLGVAGITLDSTDSYFRYVEWGLLALIAAWAMFAFRSSKSALFGHLAGAWHESRAGAVAEDEEPERETVGTGSR